jgi:DNA-binding FadR family transcriptional regulator
VTSAFDRVLDTIGAAVVRGELPAGHQDTVEGLVARTGASRSIVREATRVLGSLGLLRAGRRVGLRVLPRSDWDTLDPLVIRWRLASPDRDRQLDELTALRRAVEPEAARRAALAPAPAAVAELRAAGEELRQAGERVDPAAFLAADRRLHGLVLAMSDNAMFDRLRSVVEEALADRDRLLRGRSDPRPSAPDVALHLAVVAAISDAEPERAATLMRDIIDRTRPHTGGSPDD